MAAWGVDASEFTPEEYAHYAATSAFVYAAVRLRAVNLGQLPIKLYKRKRNGDEVEVTQGRPGSLYELMDRVNPFWDSARLIRMTEWSRCLQGAAYWWVNRGPRGMGAPSELWWVKPDRMRVVPDPQRYIAGYLYDAPMGTQVPFDAGEVVWFPLDNPIDEFAGLSPIAAARLSIDAAHDAMRSNRNIHRNGTRISGIVGPADANAPMSKAQQSEVTSLFNQLYKGIENAHKLAVVTNPIRVEKLSLSPADAQFIEQLKWTLGDVARVFGVPAELLQDREHSTYNNVKQSEKQLWQHTLIPEADDISSRLTEFLLPMFPGEADRIALDYSGVLALQEDATELTTQAQAWYGMGVPLNALLREYAPHLLPDEGRYAWGDAPKTQATDATAGTDLIDEEAKAQQEEDADTARSALALVRELRALPAPQTRAIEYGSDQHQLLLRRAGRVMDRGERAMLREVRRLFTRQQESVLARLRKRRSAHDATHTRDDDDSVAEPFDVAQWTETFQQSILPILSEIVEDAGGQVFDDLGITGAFDLDNPLIRQWLEDAAFTFAQEVNQTTIDQLRSLLQDGIDNGLSIDELADEVKALFGEISDGRAETIARTETTEAVNAGGLEAARQSGVVSGKVWLAALDNRTRESHTEAHNQERGLDEPFDVGGSAMQYPGDGSAPIEEIANCRCTLTWVLKD